MSATWEIQTALQLAAELDRQWMGKIPEAGDSRHTPWMPFPIPDFVALLTSAVCEAGGDRFLEIGCGIGTRMLLAQEIFGLDAQGIERVPEYVAQAEELGLAVDEYDASDWSGYGFADIIWFNRPFREPARQSQLEAQIWKDAKPGAVVMCANLEHRPPSSWFIVDDSWESDRYGVWQKP